jgi:hypothetical protein
MKNKASTKSHAARYQNISQTSATINFPQADANE